MIFDDIREFIAALSPLNELKRIDGADWNLEIGTLTELFAVHDWPFGPALLFDKIKDYPEGYRVVSNLYNSVKRTALVLNMPVDTARLDIVNIWRKRMKEFKPLQPVEVPTGPVKKNSYTGEAIDLYKFPTPKWHELDGGRYIGTGNAVILKDPDSDWINVGVYRVMIHDKTTLSLYISPGKHGRIIMEKYHAQGLNCPVVVAIAPEPSLFTAATYNVTFGVSELEFAGGLKGKPITLLKGEVTQLPIPATAEIAIEGEIPPPEVESRTEGRFGEATGYYGEASMQPVIKVKAIHHRNDPIIQGNPPLPRISHVFSVPLITVPNILNELELAGVPDVKGVWNLEVGGAGGWMTIVSIKQRYGGHAMQAGLVAGGCHGGAYSQKYVVVVDDDIDPTNMKEVLWAIASRTDPITSINFLRDSWSTRLEPIIHPDRKAKNDLTTSKAIIIACKPYHWIDKFPPTNQVSPELREQVIEKWRKLGIIEW